MFNAVVLGLQPPEVGNPPVGPTKSFVFRGDLMARPGISEVDSMERKIGSKINPVYANGKMTPAQEKRIWAISAASVSTILAVGATIAAFMVAPPLGIVALAIAAVILGGIAIGSTIFAATLEDLNSPQRRDEIMDKVAHQSLEQIARDYSREDLVGYALLDRVLVAPGDTTQERAVVYSRFQQLADELKRAENWAGDMRASARGTHGAATGTFKNWYNDQKVKIADARRIREQEKEMERLRRERDDLAGKPRDTVGHRVLDGIGAGVNVVIEMREKQIEQELERLYGASVSPWDKWLQNQESDVNRHFSKTAEVLEKQFAAIKR